eukprot:SAG31_NODE_43166_length_268_cov_0.615385_1_plen_21_part_10
MDGDEAPTEEAGAEEAEEAEA